MIVVLIGYMGSGKSTLGKELARSLSYSFLDLDDYIAEKETASISEIFKSKGEIYFRKKETEYLIEVINSSENIVLALGGGTPCYSNNMPLLINNTNVKSFYLKLSIPLLVDRLFTEKEKRPLISHLTSKEDLTEFIGKHLFERSQYYSQSQYMINTDRKTQLEILDELKAQLI
ncbi:MULTISPECIES: shikimate kinase [Winogradskyella]|uniref:shikimate kinase n=1 Tax=Winogradskyella TaxID=286104 RepID=UPI0015C85F35|nr:MULTISPECIES: shikimate kinase [Winogradskyella]QXP79399.1 shikimate kinase [Winogradskyella sp. HaHa_3_26]